MIVTMGTSDERCSVETPSGSVITVDRKGHVTDEHIEVRCASGSKISLCVLGNVPGNGTRNDVTCDLVTIKIKSK